MKNKEPHLAPIGPIQAQPREKGGRLKHRNPINK